MRLTTRIKHSLNLDLSVYLSITGRLWSIIKTPLSVIFITKYLDSIYQGYWYTFLSLGTLTVFAEMGFTAIITQFISHEFAYLTLKENKSVSGDRVFVERLMSLIKYSATRYLFIIPAGVLIILLISFVFFREILFSRQLIFIWLLYVFSGGATLLVSLISSIIQGINQVNNVLKVNLIANIFSTISIWVVLYLHGGIWALGISSIFLALTSMVCYFLMYKSFLIQVLTYKVREQYNWKKEVYKLQVNYSLSWIAGYFIFNFITPITLFFLGATIAGKVGITFAATSAVLQMAHTWVLNKMPELNMFVSLNKIKDAKDRFTSLNKSSVWFFILCSCVILLLLKINVFNMGKKFMTIPMVAIVLFSELAKLLFGNWAVYLRSFKVEPYLKLSILNAVFTAITFYIGLKFFKNIEYSIVIYTLIQFIALFFGFRIFRKKIKE
jgi:hypothetical protein